MSHKRVLDENEEYLHNYRCEIKLDDFLDVLTSTKFPKSMFDLVDMFQQMYDITNKCISNGINIPDKPEQWIVMKTIETIKRIYEYTFNNMQELSTFNIIGSYSSWNLITIIF